MNRTLLNLIVDLVAAALMVAMMATGYILRFPLPPGTNQSLTLWGLGRHEWGDVHFWLSLVVLAVVLFHLALHWKWVVVTIGQRLLAARGSQTQSLRAGVIASMVFAVIAVAFGAKASHDVALLAVPCCDDAPETSVVEVVPPETASEISPTVGETVTPPPPKIEAAPPGVDFSKDVYPIFERNCLKCHGPTLQLANFRVDRPEDLFGVSGGEQFIIPGDSEASSLIGIVTGKRAIRRPDAHRLKEKDVKILKAWIDKGAQWGPKSTDI